MDIRRKLYALAAGALAAEVVAYLLWRPRMLRWGATAEEASEALPGGDHTPHPRMQSTWLPRRHTCCVRGLDFFVGDPLHHYMETGMLTGIKARAEGRSARNGGSGRAHPAGPEVSVKEWCSCTTTHRPPVLRRPTVSRSRCRGSRSKSAGVPQRSRP